MAEVIPFRIDVPEAELADLRRRLRQTRWPEREPVGDWSQGVPLAYLRELCGYWADGYDWRATEARLNALPQFQTVVDGLPVHFIHLRSPHPEALPLIITHGWPDPGTFDDLTDAERSALASLEHSGEWDSGYSREHATRPQTIGYALVDSPVALAAWIVEKFWSWTDHSGALDTVLTPDELLDNLMMYWLPRTGASSARLYWESISLVNEWIAGTAAGTVDVPVGCSVFPAELQRPSRRWAQKRFTDIRYWNEPARGGHFAAFEQPELFVEEVRAFFRLVR
jgi:hypothetical protein